MPNAVGNVKGSGWTRKRAEGWERAFGSNFVLWPQRTEAEARGCTCRWHGYSCIADFDPACPIAGSHKQRVYRH